MKRYVRSGKLGDFINNQAGKVKNAVTQQIAKKFDENEIICRALLGQYKGQPMMYVFLNIIADPHVTLSDPDNLIGTHTIFYDGRNVGWIRFDESGFGMGDIKDDVYNNKIEKQPNDVLEEAFKEAFGNLMEARVPGFAEARETMRLANMMRQQSQDPYADTDDFGGYIDDGGYDDLNDDLY